MRKLIQTKIASLVKKGYKEGAFKSRDNAAYFATLWKKKGHQIGVIKSSGPVVEGGNKRNAFYVIAQKIHHKHHK